MTVPDRCFARVSPGATYRRLRDTDGVHLVATVSAGVEKSSSIGEPAHEGRWA